MKKNVLESILSTLSKCFIVLIIVVVICIALSGIKMVKSGEVAVVLRFGKIVGNTPEEQIHKPGLLFCFPYFIDEVVTIPVENVIQQNVTTHFTEGEITNWKESGYLVTGDQNIALVSASAKYMISDPISYSLYVNDAASIVNACISNAMIEAAAQSNVDDILTAGKVEFADDITSHAQAHLDRIGIGVTLQPIELTSVTMPEEVREVYENVNASTVKASTLVAEAQQYKNTNIPYAESIAKNYLATAKGNYAQALSAAETDLATFWGVVEEYEGNPDKVRARIFNEKMALALNAIGKVRLVDDGDSKIMVDWE
jgi:membrane protease subunit HflK